MPNKALSSWGLDEEHLWMFWSVWHPDVNKRSCGPVGYGIGFLLIESASHKRHQVPSRYLGTLETNKNALNFLCPAFVLFVKLFELTSRGMWLLQGNDVIILGECDWSAKHFTEVANAGFPSRTLYCNKMSNAYSR